VSELTPWFYVGYELNLTKELSIKHAIQ